MSKFDPVKFRELLLRGELKEGDFKAMYPRQSDVSIIRTARYYMRPLLALGIVRRENGSFRVRTDVLRTVEEFERIREKIGYEGDLFEFVREVFGRTREVMRRKAFVEVLAQEYGVSEKALMEFIEGFLDNVEWKTERDLRKFLEDFRKGLWVRVGSKILQAFRRENRKIIKSLKEEGYTEEEATIIALNVFLKTVPLSLELWKKVEEDSTSDIETWVIDRLAEREGMKGVELVPVDRKLYRKLQEEVRELGESRRDAVMKKLVKRLNSALEKTVKEAKIMKTKKQ